MPRLVDKLNHPFPQELKHRMWVIKKRSRLNIPMVTLANPKTYLLKTMALRTLAQSEKTN